MDIKNQELSIKSVLKLTAIDNQHAEILFHSVLKMQEDAVKIQEQDVDDFMLKTNEENDFEVKQKSKRAKEKNNIFKYGRSILILTDNILFDINNYKFKRLIHDAIAIEDKLTELEIKFLEGECK